MKKTIKIIVVLVLCKLNGLQSQTLNWTKVDTLIRGGSVNSIYHDTTDNSIYVGGSYYRIGSDTIVGIGRYKNGQWYRMGDGVDWLRTFPWCTNCIPNPVRDIIKYKDTIYITGSFSHTNNKKLNGIAKWDGTNWLPVANVGFRHGNSWGGGAKFKIYNNELYVVGTFDSIAGIVANGLAKYDGINWQAVHNLPVFSTIPSNINLIEDLEFYNGELYLTGVMFNNSTIYSTVKWNGTNWVNPGFGVYGLANTFGMFTFKNELYVVGTWSKYNNSNNVGNCIAKFDGTSWKDIGGGMLIYPNMLAGVESYAYNSNYLFVGGRFNYCNNVKGINSIARYDGTKWCSVDTTYHFGSDVLAMEFINDTLYIGGYLGAQFTPSGFAYCKNYNYTDTCSMAVNVSVKEVQDDKTILIYPNPTTGDFFVTLSNSNSSNCTYELIDLIGRVIESGRKEVSEQKIQFNFTNKNYKSGLYFLRLDSKNSQSVIKFIKE